MLSLYFVFLLHLLNWPPTACGVCVYVVSCYIRVKAGKQSEILDHLFNSAEFHFPSPPLLSILGDHFPCLYMSTLVSARDHWSACAQSCTIYLAVGEIRCNWNCSDHPFYRLLSFYIFSVLLLRFLCKNAIQRGYTEFPSSPRVSSPPFSPFSSLFITVITCNTHSATLLLSSPHSFALQGSTLHVRYHV